MDGILLVDKPTGPSSFAVINKLRKITGIKKIGHAGTLDPLASGLLVICFGRYTKLAGLLTASDKIYEAEITLGITTATDDAEGEVILKKTVSASLEDVKSAALSFKGSIDQMPPRFSAIKVNGKRAYLLARSNQEVQLQKRSVTIFDLVVEDIALPKVSVRMHCSKGTYVRSLARDLGEKLGCGGYASKIRRIKSGEFSLLDSINLDDLTKDFVLQKLQTGKNALNGALETVAINAHERDNIIHGRPFFSDKVLNDIALATFEDEIVAILRNVEGKAEVCRVI